MQPLNCHRCGHCQHDRTEWDCHYFWPFLLSTLFFILELASLSLCPLLAPRILRATLCRQWTTEREQPFLPATGHHSFRTARFEQGWVIPLHWRSWTITLLYAICFFLVMLICVIMPYIFFSDRGILSPSVFILITTMSQRNYFHQFLSSPLIILTYFVYNHPS